jgi:hypothetical protein
MTIQGYYFTSDGDTVACDPTDPRCVDILVTHPDDAVSRFTLADAIETLLGAVR